MKKTLYKSSRLFKSNALEWFTHVHPAMPFIVWGPIVSFFAYDGLKNQNLSFLTFFNLFVSGLIVWSLFEYLMHRFLFHFEPKTNFWKRIIFLFHGIHHHEPDDPTRLVMPPVVSLILGFIVFKVGGIFIANTLETSFFSGFFVGYILYDYIHYSVHHFTPKSRIGKKIKLNHMQHHFVYPNALWGVSSPFWDIIFGTFVNTSAKVSKGTK